MNAYESIRQGLVEAVAVAQGRETGARVHDLAEPPSMTPRSGPAQVCRKPLLPAASASPRARCSTGNMVVVAPLAKPRSCSP